MMNMNNIIGFALPNQALFFCITPKILNDNTFIF